jgi:dUTPase
MGMFNNVEVPMLIDTGSAVTIINEEVWKLFKSTEPLENVPFAIRSVTKHAIEIIGQKDIALQLKPKAKKGALHNFQCKVFVARGLAKEAIIGLDFLKRFEAVIDIEQNKLILHKDKVRSVHSLIGRACIGRSIAVVVKEDQVIEAKTEKRVQCALEEELEDGTLVYFEPSDAYLQTVPISIAGSIDETQNGEITTQLINPTSDTVEVKGGTIIGTIDTVSNRPEENSGRHQERTSASSDWLKKVDVGKAGFSQQEQKAIYDLLKEFEGVFSKGEYDLGRTSIIQHSIEIIGEKPKRCGSRPLNPTMRKELETQLQEMLKNDLIQPSTSEYSCPVVLVKKKCGAIRFCCDFRRLNDATRKDSYPLPRINEIINTLAGAKLFSTMDCKSGYHQLALKPEDAHKTAFATQYGLYEWKVMPMGLCNAPSSWQRLMDLLMTGLNWHGVLVYLDDLLVFGRNFEEHHSRLREVLTRLQHANIKLSPKKCHILQKEVTYLGHVISNGEVKPDPEKTKLIDTYPVPKSIKDVRSFVSLASYYRRFVKNFAQVTKPLTQMLEKGKEFHWSMDCQHAFDVVKEKLGKETKLQLPDFSKPFRLACDASGVAIGAVLSQLDEDGKEKPIAFASKVLSKTERRWTVTERELYALYHFVLHFKGFLYGQPFELISDHRPLVWLRTLKNPSPKLTRWLLQLEAFNFTVSYKEGKTERKCRCYVKAARIRVSRRRSGDKRTGSSRAENGDLIG